MHWRRKWQPTPVFLPGESQGRGSQWAAVYGVAQSQTRLKWLSSSSSRGRHEMNGGRWIWFWEIWFSQQTTLERGRGDFLKFLLLLFGLIKEAFQNAYSVQFSHSVVSNSATPWTTACQASLSINNSQSPPKPMSIESMMPSNHLILCRPFSSCLQSFPASGSFPMSQLFAPGGQSIGVSASASFLPMNTQDWSPIGWTSWISLQFKGLSGVFSNTTVQKHQFFSTQLSL